MQETARPWGWLVAALLTFNLWLGCSKPAEDSQDNPADSSAQVPSITPAGDTGHQASSVNERNEPSPSVEPIEVTVQASTPTVPAEIVAAPAPPVAVPVKVIQKTVVARPAKLPANTRHLPEDSTFIVSARIGDLLEKGGYQDFLKSDLVKMVKAQLVDNQLAQKILDNPEASGIDLSEPAHVFIKLGAPVEEFGEPTVTGGLVASLKDAKAFNSAIDLITAQVELPLIKTAQEGYTQLSMPGAPATIGWSPKALVAVGSSDPKQMQKIANLLEKTINRKSKIKDDRLAALLGTKADLSAWVDYNAIMKLMAEAMPPGAEDAFGFGLVQKFSKDLAYAITVDFQPGKVSMGVDYHYDNELFQDDYSKGGLDAGLVNLIPADSILVAAEAVQMKPVREMVTKHVLPALGEGEFGELIQQAEAMIGLTVGELLEIPKGDFLAVWDGLEMKEGDFGPQPAPKLLLGMTVENRKPLNKIMNNPQVQALLPMLATVGLQIAQSEEGVFLCSRNHANAINNGKAEAPVKGAHRALIAKNDIGGYFRFAPLAQMIQGLAPDEAEAQMVIAELKRLNEVTFSSNFEKGRQSGIVALSFKDEKTNALKQLIQTGERVYKLAQTAGIGAPGFGAEAEAVPDVQIEEGFDDVAPEPLPELE